MGRQVHFVGYCTIGPSWHNNGSWRHDESDGTDFLDPARYENIAKILEAGKFDGLFFVDVQTLYDTFGGSVDPCIKYGGHMCMLDPMQMLTAMARVTEHIGLSATMSTSLYHPFHIARAFASLDHISGGRAAWNIVTSATDREAQNYGMDQLLEKSLRYDHADEVVEACQALWNSWKADALVLDRQAGIFGDPSKVHYANYRGKYVKTRGPLMTPHSPQGSPVLMQAGSSERGRQFAARWAEVIFTLQNNKADMQKFYRDVKDRVANAGRDPSQCAILPATDIVIGETESIARERANYINSLANAELGLSEMSNHIGVDLSGFDMDKPLSEMEITQGARGVFDIIMSGGKGKTLRDAGYQYATTQMSPQLIGTPMMIADHIHELFEAEACDGFVICPSITPGSFYQFVKSVVPELQRRGIYRKDYAGKTFRENLRS
ncbi:LLM class flavin-dependent oxidoreductase [Mesorhizobium sp. CN2-181]|uniref:LLM class flavin-dependent oxidoreductase n=1 Tax=Mesorhizobium yinganensis TaxID=3157707 RepID=UPI0032B8769F